MSLEHDQMLWKARGQIMSIHNERERQELTARWQRSMRQGNLMARIDEAVAWGTPDNESTGMTHSALCSLLAEAKSRIQQLEDQLRSK